jgi:uncharacterized membrane protein YedE/YeeE
VIRATAAGFGIVFGFVLSWTGLADPSFIHKMLSLQTAYPYLLMATSIALTLTATRLLARGRAHAVLTHEPVQWSTLKPERRHVIGGSLFGLGWAMSSACPGPVAAQLGQGFGWGLCTALGIFVGVRVFLRREVAEAHQQTGLAPQAP